MSFYKITDPQKRDEMMEEFIRTKKNIQNQSFEKLLSDKRIYTQGEKLFKPIIDAQREEGEKIAKELELANNALKPLQELPGVAPYLAIKSPKELKSFKGLELGEMATKALSEALSKQGDYDNITGIYKNESDGLFYIGDKQVEFNENNLIVDGEEYVGTPGLWRLITSKHIDGGYTVNDYEIYSDLMKRLNALKSEKDPRRPKVNRGDKWKNILKPIWDEQKSKKKGKGIKLPQVTFLPSDPGMLLEQLKLSLASNHAGNTGERNKIVSILEILLKMGAISRDEYKAINLNIK